MKYNNWNVLSPPPECVGTLEQAGVSPLAARVLSARGCQTAEHANEYLRRDATLLNDPFLLKDMDKAVCRLGQALEEREPICVYGDYDVDGITATCLLTSYLLDAGGRVIPYVPNRLTEGYSLNKEAIDQLHEQGISLIITVDCGITNVEETEYARKLGMDVIITDHHECKDLLPDAAAVVNPHRPDCTYPFPMLAGVGVALKVALAMTPPVEQEAVLSAYADFAAIGTVADVMELQGENRAIVSLGLQTIQQNCRPGLTALIREAGQEHRTLTTGSISFSLAPRLNASGRMGCPELAVELLMTRDDAQAEVLARQLCALNRDRQEIELETFEECMDHLTRRPEEAEGAIVLASPNWHQGVVGIVASRLSERFHVPVFMICLEGEHGKGSCRSWGQFNLYQALKDCADLLENYGGHELAAGFNIKKDQIPAFRKRMSQLAGGWLNANPCDSALTIDARLERMTLLSRENVIALEQLEPHGTGNPTPVFLLEDVTVQDYSRVGNGRHIRLHLQKDGITLDGIFFSATPKEVGLNPGCKMDVAFTPQINEFRGNRTVQLQLVDCRPASLYTRYCSGLPLSGSDLAKLTPSRQDFVAVWRYLTRFASDGLVQDSPERLSQKIARSAGHPANFSRTMVCLEVFHERGLIQLQNRPDFLHITICKTDRKVDLESSEILIRLRRRRHE